MANLRSILPRAVQARLFRDQRGVTAIEYGLIAALISVVIILAVTNVGTEVHSTFKTWSDAVDKAIK